MKASVLKVTVLVVLLTVFCIVALTARWAEKSGYGHINHRNEQSVESVPDSAPHWDRVDSFNAGADATQAEPDTENPFLAAWIARSDSNHDEAEMEGQPDDRKLNRFSKNIAQDADSEGGEDPDDNKDTYGDADVE